MGTGEAEGEEDHLAAEMAISNPLIDDYTLKRAKGLVNITGGKDLKLLRWMKLKQS